MQVHHLQFMQEALKEAKRALLEKEVPIGAVLADAEGRILARAHNQSIALNDPTAHAEVLAIRRAAETVKNYRLEDTTLYVTVEPCVMCSGALIWGRVKRLVYGAQDLKGGGVDSLYQIPRDMRLNHTVEVVAGVMEKECRELIQKFFEDLRSRENVRAAQDLWKKK